MPLAIDRGGQIYCWKSRPHPAGALHSVPLDLVGHAESSVPMEHSQKCRNSLPIANLPNAAQALLAKRSGTELSACPTSRTRERFPRTGRRGVDSQSAKQFGGHRRGGFSWRHLSHETPVFGHVGRSASNGRTAHSVARRWPGPTLSSGDSAPSG